MKELMRSSLLMRIETIEREKCVEKILENV